MTKQLLDLNEASEDVHIWNELAGNKLEDTTLLSLFNQAKVFKEEAEEMFQAIQALYLVSEGKLDIGELEKLNYNPALEVLDGALDSVFTFTRVLDKLEHLGFDLDKGWRKVVSNNHDKFLTKEEAEYELLLQPELTMLEQTAENGQVYYTLRDSNNKIKKPSDFVSVDLTDCLPEII